MLLLETKRDGKYPLHNMFTWSFSLFAVELDTEHYLEFCYVPFVNKFFIEPRVADSILQRIYRVQEIWFYQCQAQNLQNCMACTNISIVCCRV